MYTIRTIAKAVAALTVSATFVYAGNEVLPGEGAFNKYGEAEGWTVYVDVDRSSCLIERMDAQANVVQMGLTSDHKLGYVGVFSKAADLAGGSREMVTIDIDGTLYEGKATRMKKNITDGYTGGYLLANNPAFIEDVAKKYSMTVFPQKEDAFVVDLAGTYKAMEMARACNAEQN